MSESGLWSVVFGWPVVGAVVILFIGSAGIGVLSMNPPQHTIAQVALSAGSLILVARTVWWLAFEQRAKNWEISVFAFVFFGMVGILWVLSLRWISGLRQAALQKETPPQSATNKQPLPPAPSGARADSVGPKSLRSKPIQPSPFSEGIPDTVTIVLAGGFFHARAELRRSDLEKHKYSNLLVIGGERPLTLYIQDGVFYADALITDQVGNRAIRIIKNTIEVKPPEWDRNFSANALEVVDGNQRPIFQMVRKRSNMIQVSGLFVSASGAALDVRSDKQIFKYPAWKYPGVYAESEPRVEDQKFSGYSQEDLKLRTSEYVRQLREMYAEFNKDFMAVDAQVSKAIQQASSKEEKDKANLSHIALHEADDRKYEARLKEMLPEGRSLEAEVIRRVYGKAGSIAPAKPFELESGRLNGPDSLSRLAAYFENLTRKL